MNFLSELLSRVTQKAIAAVTTNGGGTGQTIQLQNPLGASCNNLTCPLTTVTNFLFTIAIPLCGIIILIGGFQMMTAAGNPEKFSKGRKTLLYAVIGFVVVLLAGSVATLIRSTLGGN
jgi:Type IV secretion system pilin